MKSNEEIRKELMNDIADHFIKIEIMDKASKKYFKLANLKIGSEYRPLLVFPLYYLDADFTKKEIRFRNTKFIWEAVMALTAKKKYQFTRILFLTKKLEEKNLYHGISYNVEDIEYSLNNEYICKFNIFPKVHWRLEDKVI